MANPIEDSAAATVNKNKPNNWPKISSKKTEKKKNVRLIDRIKISNDMSISKILFLLKIIPKTPIIKREVEKKRVCDTKSK
jgi:hypothetical protein